MAEAPAIWPFSKTSFLLCNIDPKLRATGPVRHFATCHRTQELVLLYQKVPLSALVLYFISVIQWGFFSPYVCVHTAQHRQEAMGIGCDVVRVEIEEGLSKDHLLETFINCGRTFISTARLIILH